MGIDHKKLQTNRAARRQGFGWKPMVGTTRVRILPPHTKYLKDWDSLESLAIIVASHYFKVDNKPTVVSLCLKENGEHCPACAMYEQYKKCGDHGLESMAREVRASHQYHFNMFDLNNLSAGLQYWPGNFKCWDGIMDVATNAAWGNCVDPANGVNFTINMTAGSSHPSGRNQYSVTPEPERSDITAVLAAIEGWEATLDGLAGQRTDALKTEEILLLLAAIGFPNPGGGKGGGTPAPTVPTTPTSGTVAPTPIPAPVAVVQPPGSEASEVTSAPPVEVVTPPVVVAPRVEGQAQEVATAVPHYTPPEGYVPKLPLATGAKPQEGERPIDAPLCYGDYEPTIHLCAPCPYYVPCQMLMLGVTD